METPVKDDIIQHKYMGWGEFIEQIDDEYGLGLFPDFDSQPVRFRLCNLKRVEGKR